MKSDELREQILRTRGGDAREHCHLSHAWGRGEGGKPRQWISARREPEWAAALVECIATQHEELSHELTPEPSDHARQIRYAVVPLLAAMIA